MALTKTDLLTLSARNGRSGCVNFLRTSDASLGTDDDTFGIFTPDGYVVEIPSDDTTGGLQAAINYAVNNGFDFYADGGGIANRPTTGTVGLVRTVSVEKVYNGAGGAGTTHHTASAVNGTYNNIDVTGGTGSGLKVNIIVASNVITSITVAAGGSGYMSMEALTVAADSLGVGSQAFNIYPNTGSDVGVITPTQTITIPPCQNRSFTFKSITLDVRPAITTEPAIRFDSCMMVDFDFRGQIGYGGIGNAVEFNGRTRLPYDAQVAIVDSHFRIDSIAYISNQGGTVATDSALVHFKSDCHRNTFSFNELNGSGFDATTQTVTPLCYNGILLGNYGIIDNLFNVGAIHHVNTSGIQIGTSTAAAVKGNDFRVGLIECSEASTTAYAVNSYGQYNKFDFSTNNGAGDFEAAYKGHTSTVKEYVIIRKCEGNTATAEFTTGHNAHKTYIWNGTEGELLTPTNRVGKLILDLGPELTIASGVITVTHSFHTVDTQSDAGSDDLDTINGGVAGQMLTLRANNDARTVVLKDDTGNLRLNGDRSLDHSRDSITLIYIDDTHGWVESTFTSNA